MNRYDDPYRDDWRTREPRGERWGQREPYRASGRGDRREPQGSRYGSGDFGYEWGRRGEPEFGEHTESPRYFGAGNYAEGGSHFTGGEPRGSSYYGYTGGDYGYDGRLGGDYGGSRSEPRYSQRQAPRLYRRGPKGYQRSDERLKEEISERLMQAAHVDSSEVTVNVSSGKVTLEGTVPDRYMKYYIEDLSEACPGVQDVENRIRVNAGQSQNQASQNR